MKVWDYLLQTETLWMEVGNYLLQSETMGMNVWDYLLQIETLWMEIGDYLLQTEIWGWKCGTICCNVRYWRWKTRTSYSEGRCDGDRESWSSCRSPRIWICARSSSDFRTTFPAKIPKSREFVGCQIPINGFVTRRVGVRSDSRKALAASLVASLRLRNTISPDFCLKEGMRSIVKVSPSL